MSKIRKSAKGEECQIRIPGVCNFNSETTVLCHIGGAGVALKSHDIHGAYGCSSCHDVIDMKVKSKYDRREVVLWFHESVFRTQLILLEQELINV